MTEDNLTFKDFQKWCEHIDNFRLPVAKHVVHDIEFKGVGVELGAGTCWFSAFISSIPSVRKVWALDLNANKLVLAKKYFIPHYKGIYKKIIINETDYHQLPFQESSVDFVFVDAALHHAKDLRSLLNEVKRVLKPSGFLVAVREPILPSLEPLRSYRKYSFGWKEKRKGDIECIYSRKIWENYFEKAGFDLDIREFFPNSTLKERLVKKLRIFNGYLFCRYYMIVELK